MSGQDPRSPATQKLNMPLTGAVLAVAISACSGSQPYSSPVSASAASTFDCVRSQMVQLGYTIDEADRDRGTVLGSLDIAMEIDSDVQAVHHAVSPDHHDQWGCRSGERQVSRGGCAEVAHQLWRQSGPGRTGQAIRREAGDYHHALTVGTNAVLHLFQTPEQAKGPPRYCGTGLLLNASGRIRSA